MENKKAIDWTGIKIGMLTFIEKTQQIKHYYKTQRGFLWKVECDCGKIAYAVPREVAKIKNPNCGCIPTTRIKDRTNQRAGRLTFIRPTNKKTYSEIIWEAQCDCGSPPIEVIPSQCGDGGKISCGCADNERAKKFGSAARKYEPIESTARIVWRTHYSDCEFNIFLELSQKDCHYCGSPPSRTFNKKQSIRKGKRQISDFQLENGNFTYNGLDRVNSEKGHTPDNVVPCCYPCNWMKSNMPVDVWFDHIERIYNHTAERRELMKRDKEFAGCEISDKEELVEIDSCRRKTRSG